MVEQNTVLQKHLRLFFLFITSFFIVMFIASCGLFDKEIKQDQHIASFRYQLGRVQDSLDKHRSRIKAYEAIIEEINGDDYLITPRKKNNLLIEANVFLYNESLSVEDYRSAIRYSDTIINIDSTFAKGYYNRGCVYQVISKDSLAIRDYTKAISLNSDYADAYYNRGILYEQQEKLDQALFDYDKAIRLNPPYIADIYNNRGNVYLEKDIVDKAINDYSKALEKDTSNVKTYCNRAWAYMAQKDFDKALADCDNAIALDSVNVNAYIKRALVYEGKEEYNKAIADYKTVLKLDPYDKFSTHEVAQQAIHKLKPMASRKRHQ